MSHEQSREGSGSADVSSSTNLLAFATLVMVILVAYVRPVLCNTIETYHTVEDDSTY